MAPVKKRASKSKHHVNHLSNLPGSIQVEQSTNKINNKQGGLPNTYSATEFSKMMRLLSKNDNLVKGKPAKTEGIRKEERTEVIASNMQNDCFNSWCSNNKNLENSIDISQEISPNDSVSKTLIKSYDIFESKDVHKKSFKQVMKPENKIRKRCDQIKCIVPVPERISSTETLETEASYDCLRKDSKMKASVKQYEDESHGRENDTVYNGGLCFGDYSKNVKDQNSSTSMATTSSVETCISNVTAKNMDDAAPGITHSRPKTCYPSSKKVSDEKLIRTLSKAKVKQTASHTQQDNWKISRSRGKKTSRTNKTQAKSSGLETTKRILCVGAAWASPAIIACYLIARICGYSYEEFVSSITKKI